MALSPWAVWSAAVLDAAWALAADRLRRAVRLCGSRVVNVLQQLLRFWAARLRVDVVDEDEREVALDQVRLHGVQRRRLRQLEQTLQPVREVASGHVTACRSAWRSVTLSPAGERPFGHHSVPHSGA